MCPFQFWINRTNFGIIFGPAGPLLVAKIGPAGPISPPDQIFRDRAQAAVVPEGAQLVVVAAGVSLLVVPPGAPAGAALVVPTFATHSMAPQIGHVTPLCIFAKY